MLNYTGFLQHFGLDARLQLLIEQGASSTLDYMQQFWLNADGTSEHLWNVRRDCFWLGGDRADRSPLA